MPSRLIPRLLVVFTRQLEILVTTLQKANKNMQKRSLAWSQNNEASKVYHFAIKKYITKRNQVKLESHLTCISHTLTVSSADAVTRHPGT